jgi:predicted kinase
MPMITLIAGPPCAGKTTLARQLAESGHVVIDFDDIAVRLGSPRGWRHPQPIITAANAVMARELAELRARDDVTAWVIRSAPRAVLRAHLAATLGARVWLLDPGLAECLRRARRASLRHRAGDPQVVPAVRAQRCGSSAGPESWRSWRRPRRGRIAVEAPQRPVERGPHSTIHPYRGGRDRPLAWID